MQGFASHVFSTYWAFVLLPDGLIHRPPAASCMRTAAGVDGIRCMALHLLPQLLAAPGRAQLPQRYVLYVGSYSGSLHRLLLPPPGGGDAAEADMGAHAPGPRSPGTGHGGWQLLYNPERTAGQAERTEEGTGGGGKGMGAITCLEVCAVAAASPSHRQASGEAAPSTVTDGAQGSGSGAGGGAWVLIGHNSGQATVLGVDGNAADGPQPQEKAPGCSEDALAAAAAPEAATAMVLASWRATRTGAVIAAWWMRALGRHVVATVGGDAAAVRLWRLPAPGVSLDSRSSGAEDGPGGSCSVRRLLAPMLAAVAQSPLPGRLLVADVCSLQLLEPRAGSSSACSSRDAGVLLAGDQHGNLVAFLIPPPVWQQLTTTSSTVAVPPAAVHPEQPTAVGISAVPEGIGGCAAVGSLSSAQAQQEPVQLPVLAVFRGALGPAAASWVHAQAPAPGTDSLGDFVAAGREGVLVRLRVCRTTTGLTATAAAAVAAAGAGAQQQVQDGAPVPASDVTAAFAASHNRASSSDSGGNSYGVGIECLGSQSRTAVASIELVWERANSVSPPATGALPASPAGGSGSPAPPSNGDADLAAAVPLSGLGSGGGGGPDAMTLVAGFHGSDFLLVGLCPDPLQLLRVPSCGGWRRTHALHLAISATSAASAAQQQQGEAGIAGTGVGLAFAYVVSDGSIKVLQKGTPPQQLAPAISAPPLASKSAASSSGLAPLVSVRQPLPRSLHVGHHGREVLCSCILTPAQLPAIAAEAQLSSDHADSGAAAALPPVTVPQPLVLLTGAEDGSIRRVTAMPCSRHSCAGGTSTGPGSSVDCDRRYALCFEDGAVVGEHAAGTAVRCLEACSLPPNAAAALGVAVGSGAGRRAAASADAKGSSSSSSPRDDADDSCSSSQAYLVVSAGVKEVMMAWLVCLEGVQPQQQPQQHASEEQERPQPQQAQAAGNDAGLRVWSRWLSTQPPRQGLRPKSLRVAQPAPSGDRLVYVSVGSIQLQLLALLHIPHASCCCFVAHMALVHLRRAPGGTWRWRS